MSPTEREPFLRLNAYKFVNYRFVFERTVANCTRKCTLILDAGCGRGGSIICLPDNVELIGIDVLRANVEACRRRWRKRMYVVADLTMLPFAEGAFGGALSADVLEHVGDKTAAVNELARTTKIDGFFVGCSSNILNPVLFLDAKFPLLMKPLVMKFAEQGHYERQSRFSPQALKKTLKLTGYRMDCLYLLGYPQFEQTNTLPGLTYLWILFDKLTRKKALVYLKEILVWQATRVQGQLKHMD
jgi:ubiquinone/menaquinone biosynthesis C-methylase UbiE